MSQQPPHYHAILASPLGPIRVTGDGRVLTAIHINGEDGPFAPRDPLLRDPLLREAIAQLEAYFAGTLTIFDLPLAPALTPRGPAHRAAIVAIGHGETASYGEVARRIGSGPRAVGQACRRNPFPIVVPCHRILAAGQAIGHYSAGDGISTKRRLLDHERRRML